MRPPSHWPRLDVLMIAAYLGAGLPLQIWSAWATPVPLMNYGLPPLSNLAAYAVGGPLAALYIWRGSPRGRLAAYVFLTFDLVRSMRLGHPLPAALDAAIVLYLQTPAMRRLYPSMWSRRHAFARRWLRG